MIYRYVMSADEYDRAFARAVGIFWPENAEIILLENLDPDLDITNDSDAGDPWIDLHRAA